MLEQWRQLGAAGLSLARAGNYFAAHEVWENLWLELHGEDRLWVQALIQLVVSRHHTEAGNTTGAASLEEKACLKLERLATVGFVEPDWARGLGLPLPFDVLAWRLQAQQTAGSVRPDPFAAPPDTSQD